MNLPKQVIKFSLIGGAAAVIDLGGYFLVTRLWHTDYMITSVLTSLTAVSFAFLSNRYWTFAISGNGAASQYFRFLLVYVLGTVWQNVLLFWLVEFVRTAEWFNRISFKFWPQDHINYVSLGDIFAKVIAILIVAYSWNFVLAKFWVFRYNRSDYIKQS